MVDREDPAANTAMFQAFAHRRDVEQHTQRRGVSPAVWVAAGAVLVVLVVVLVWLLA